WCSRTSRPRSTSCSSSTPAARTWPGSTTGSAWPSAAGPKARSPSRSIWSNGPDGPQYLVPSTQYEGGVADLHRPVVWLALLHERPDPLHVGGGASQAVLLLPFRGEGTGERGHHGLSDEPPRGDEGIRGEVGQCAGNGHRPIAQNVIGHDLGTQTPGHCLAGIETAVGHRHLEGAADTDGG